MLYFGHSQGVAVALDIHVAPAVSDDQDALAAATVRGFDDEVSMPVNHTLEVLGLAHCMNQSIEFGYGEAGRNGETLGLDLVIDPRIQGARVVRHDVTAIAVIDADHAGCFEFTDAA